MGGSQQRKCSAFSFCGLFKVRKPRRTGDDASDDDDGMSARKTLPFDDDDKGHPFDSVKPDPLVDSKADAFIAKFHAALIAESEREVPQQAAGKAG
ncbi:hypothetical protein OIU77_003750 [Salix suchowensis]|uniref:Uncharacterized protein n=1 Tax=Salix suchowensis TaxID=1278906 RepID=A0ABQ9AUS2_9ROSI|nr:hypothetical protein OIU77_003750 [Salix suchowensis]